MYKSIQDARPYYCCRVCSSTSSSQERNFIEGHFNPLDTLESVLATWPKFDKNDTMRCNAHARANLSQATLIKVLVVIVLH